MREPTHHQDRVLAFLFYLKIYIQTYGLEAILSIYLYIM